jgi:hypothetical protein
VTVGGTVGVFVPAGVGVLVYGVGTLVAVAVCESVAVGVFVALVEVSMTSCGGLAPTSR